MWDPLPLRMLPLLAAGLTPHLFAQAPTTRLEGLVLDPLSQPVGNARITVEVDGEVIARGQSDGSGTFLLGRLPSGLVTVRATTAGPDVGATTVDLLAEPRGFARIHVMPARKVSGTVLDDAGKAIAGAWLACAPMGTPEFGAVGCHTLSDAEGRFELTHVPFGKVALRAWAAPHEGFAVDLDGRDDATVACTLGREDVQERAFEMVHATPEHRATARLDVSVWADGTELLLPPALRQLAIGEDGRWLVPGWPYADEMRAQVELATALAEPGQIAIPADSGPRTMKFYVSDGEQVELRGRIVGEGLPIGGLQLLADGYARRNAVAHTSGTTAADGTFTLLSPVPRGVAFQLRCGDPAFALYGSGDREEAMSFVGRPRGAVVAKQKAGTVHEFTLVRAHTVRGVVRDAQGTGLAGVEVALLSQDRTRWTRVVGPRRTVEHDEAQIYARGRTGADGTFVLDGLPLREGEAIVYQIVGPRGLLEAGFDVGAGVDQNLGDLVVGPAGALAGQVLDADGKPVPGARLVIDNLTGTVRQHVLAAGRDGRFVLQGLVPGPCVVQLAGQSKNAQVVTVTKGEVTEITVQ